jgi:exo-1,4-beta-D-glucosaminidase
MPLKTSLALLLASMLLATYAHARTVAELRENWRLQSACKFEAAGDAISQPGFPTEGWLKTAVPSTVLAAQAAAGQVPDPYFGLNLRQIPGTDYPIGKIFANLPMSETSPYRCGWWYRTEFSAPAVKDERVWLHFAGLNYRGDIWLNGKKIADSATVAGAYRTYDFDITEALKPGKPNILAVETFAPTEKDLGINWVDWNPCPPDKDMGLWGAVNLVTTGAVTLRSPLAVTHFSDNSLTQANLTLYAELQNATGQPIKGKLEGTAAGITFEQPIALAPHEDRTAVFTPEAFPQFKLRNPQPWWPSQMGKPHLERLAMHFIPEGSKIPSDERSVDFGIREITSELTDNGSRLFRINGKPILIRGAGWSQDMLLRTDSKRLRQQFELVREMNLNTIRLEGKLETEEFFHLADEQGILVMLGWCCCDHWEHWKDWTDNDLAIATASLHDQMLRLRSHASLLVWLNGSDGPPPTDVENAYLKVESDTHWPNPILSSASAEKTKPTGPSGVKMTGPYDYVAPSYWYVDHKHGGAWGYNTETSPGPAIPSLASRQKFLSDPEAWPPTADWSFHNGSGKFATLSVFDSAMEASYAKPSSAADFERIAQTMEYDSERAMFESYSRNKYTASTGVIQWMLNNAWPSMIWHLYDYYLDAGAGYFATKKACEPLHIQYSYDDHTVVVVNSTYKAAPGLKASIHVHSLDWKELYSTDAKLDAASDSSQSIATLPKTLYSGTGTILFVDLTLSDAAGHTVSRNFYWVPNPLTTFDFGKTTYVTTPAEHPEDLTALTHLPQAKLTTHASIETTARGRELLLRLTNPSTALAFQVHAALRTPAGGLIAPVFWSDNWVEVLPGETRTLTALLPENAGPSPEVRVEGWNIAAETLKPAAQ